jgi:hypothetical protein
MIHNGYCQLLHSMDMYHIWYMFIDNSSMAPIAVYHICYTPAVERVRTIPLRNIWKYVYCIIYGTKCSEGLNITLRNLL